MKTSTDFKNNVSKLGLVLIVHEKERSHSQPKVQQHSHKGSL